MRYCKPYGSKTEARIKASLNTLLQTHHLEKITVKMICEKAGCDRSTFYLFFSGMDDLIESVKTDIYSQYFARDFEIDDILQKKILAFEIIAANKGFFLEYYNYYASNNLSALSAFENKDNEEYKQKYSERLTDARASFIKGGVDEVIRQWLASGCEKPAEELADELIDIVNSILLPEPDDAADNMI